MGSEGFPKSEWPIWTLYPSSKNYQVDRDNNNLGESNMFKEKVINNPRSTVQGRK